MTRAAVVLALFMTACMGGAPTSTPTAQPSLAPTASPSLGATHAAVPSESPAVPSDAGRTPTTAAIAPEEVIPADNAGNSINMVAFGDEVWATIAGGLLRINAQTGEATAVEYSEPASQARYLTASADSIWLADFYNRAVLRLDPTSGEVTGTTDVPGDPRAILSGEDEVWAPVAGGPTYRIDPETMAVVGEPIAHQASAYGLSRLWVGNEDNTTVLSVDPDSGSVVDRIAIPEGGSGCRVGGRFPDAVWGWCGLESNRSVVTRLDPASGEAVASVDLGGNTGSWGGVLVIEDGAWFPLIARARGESGLLVRVNLETNEVDRVLDGGPEFDANELVVAGDSLWASMEGAQEVWRFKLEQLNPVP